MKFLRYFLATSTSVLGAHFRKHLLATTQVMTESRALSTISSSSPLKPPDSVRGMTELNRERFSRSILCPCVSIPVNQVGNIIKDLKPYLFKMPRFQSLRDDAPGQKLALLDLNTNLEDLPTREKLERLGVSFLKKEVTISYDNFKPDEIFRAVIPDHIDAVSGFSLIGHIVHLNLRDELASFKPLIGQVLLDKIPQAKTVVNKTNSIDSTYRHFSMELLAGENNYVTQIRENKCTFELDFSKVYWNPRLCTEHERVINDLSPGDYLFDVFAGIGPFAVPAGKKGVRVYANDLNPSSVEYLRKNIALNKLTPESVTVFNKDGFDFIKDDFKTVCSSLNMAVKKNTDNFKIVLTLNLPQLAPSFLPAFKGLFKDFQDSHRPSVLAYVYCFSKNAPEPKNDAVRIVEEALELKLTQEELVGVSFVRNVAPNKEMMRIVVRLSPRILYDDDRIVRKRSLEDSETGRETKEAKKGHKNMEVRTVGLIVIGDEVLKGQVADQNIHFFAQKFRNLGIKLSKVSVIGDTTEEIAREVAEFSNKFDRVVTTGGIGPTHDDVTYEGIALAFNEPLTVNSDVWSVYGFMKNSGVKMSTVPKSSDIISIDIPTRLVSGGKFPVVTVRNVCILPGVPTYTKFLFDGLLAKRYFVKTNQTFYTRRLYLNVFESHFAEILNDAVDKFNKTVTFGSYPKTNNPFFKTIITIESLIDCETHSSYEYLKSRMKSDWIIEDGHLLGDSWNRANELIMNGSLGDFGPKLLRSIEVVKDALNQFKLDDQIFISYNGGKDCTALLHLIHLTVNEKLAQDLPVGRVPLTAVYIRPRHPLPQVEEFIKETKKRYNLTLVKEFGPIKEALSKLSQTEKGKPWKAVFMGTRSTDPGGKNLKTFQKTDEGWVELVRVSPLLDWTYNDVWTFLRKLEVPYCSLYDQGYTSLDHAANSQPNEALRYVDDDGQVKYRPAYNLEDVSLERSNRGN